MPAGTSGRAGPKEATNPSETSSEFWPDGRRTELCAPKPRGRAVRIFCGASCFSGALLRSHSGIRQQVDSRGPTSFGRASGGCLRSLSSPIWAYEGPPVDLPIWDCMFAAACPREFSRSVRLALRQQRGVKKCVSLGMLVVSMFCGMIGMTLCRLRPRTPQTFSPKEPRTPQTFLPKEPQASTPRPLSGMVSRQDWMLESSRSS